MSWLAQIFMLTKWHDFFVVFFLKYCVQLKMPFWQKNRAF